jgi:hypothetical protein
MTIAAMTTRLLLFATLASSLAILSFQPVKDWQSKHVRVNKEGTLAYTLDEKGNTIPDFSRVGYYQGDQSIPEIAVVKTITPTANDRETIQAAIDEVAARPLDAQGFRGTILLKKGTYKLSATLRIPASGIVLRGEGDQEGGTRLIADFSSRDPLLEVSGKGSVKEVPGTRVAISDHYVPAGAFSFSVASAEGFKKGDRVIVYRPGTQEWIHDLKMDQIVERPGTKQWKPGEYNLSFERVITAVDGNRIFIDNPVVMPMETKYGGGAVFKYTFEGRINHVGVEQLYFESVYTNDTAENHSWDAVVMDKVENGWVRQVTARYFAYSCVNLQSGAKNISVLDARCFDAKSVITGGRRYSFNNNGQQSLFMNCHTAEGRHDFVTGARVCGPNVFVHCTARKTHADIGPHHRWAVGTLYDNIITDGEINIQDRGNMGSGHGWVGTTQVLWNCTARRAAVQNPYVTGLNYCIGLKGTKAPGHFKDRPDGFWEGENRPGLQPASLYLAQLKARQSTQTANK